VALYVHYLGLCYSSNASFRTNSAGTADCIVSLYTFGSFLVPFPIKEG